MNTPNRRLRIAVADDEADMCQFLREVLGQLGHDVVLAAQSGKELVEKCQTEKPDLVITDIRMPDMSGLEAGAAINRERPVPVVLVTAHPEVDFLGDGAAN